MVVDGISQRPRGTSHLYFPVDHASDKVLGKLDRFDPQGKFAAARCDCLYEGLLLRRALRLCGHCVVDVFDVEPTTAATAAAPRQFDYVLHVDGALANSSVPLTPRSGALGQACGYQYVAQRQCATAAGPVALTFAAAEKRLRIWIVPCTSEPTEVILADGLTDAPDRTMPMLLLRRRAASTRYITVFEPLSAAAPLHAVRWKAGTEGRPGGLVLEGANGTRRVPLE